jgi:hypothetical protein
MKKKPPPRRGIKMTLAEDLNLIDLREWSLETVTRFTALFEQKALEAASEALRIAVREYPADGWFPIVNMDPADVRHEVAQGHDLTELWVRLPLGRDEGDDQPTWKLSLDKAIYEELDTYVTVYEGDPGRAFALSRLRDGFLALAAKIDKTLTDHPPDPEEED